MTANDVCGAGDECQHPVSQKYLDAWVKGTDDLIANVSRTMKRVYVNLISTLDLSNIARLQRTTAFCSLEHRVILRECGCIDRGNATELKQLDENTHAMNAQLHLLAQNWTKRLAASGRDDMAVVVQPFQEGIGANLDLSFLNKLDCFHPSTVAHQDLAIGLWNSMLCTSDRKGRCGQSFTADIKPVCPTIDSTFYTGPDVTPDPPIFRSS